MARQSLLARLSALVSAGDLTMVVLGLVCAYWFRFSSGLVPQYHDPDGLQDGLAASSGYWSSGYWKLILLGSLVVFLGLVSKDMSRLDDLLSPRRIKARLMGVVLACLVVFLAFSLTVRTVPPISRSFVVFAAAFVPLAVYTWRLLLARLLRRPSFSMYLRQRLLLVGCSEDACRIRANAMNDPTGHTDVVGCVLGFDAGRKDDEPCPCGQAPMHDVAAALENYAVDVVVLTDTNIPEAEVTRVASICEHSHVEFKMVPRYFQILISSLRPGMIGPVPVLGVEALPLNRPENRLLKRGVDLIGALAGMVVSAPLMTVFGALVFLESPGPIFYRQVRMGRNGRLFTMFKIRSMRLDAEDSGGAQWATKDDPRRLRIGAFMRRWNIDELPQFWNVLKGDMSLVGPRPERPELIEKFKWQVPHYSVRHTCSPGLTGWAQVNGWRGDTSLVERIRHDIWYVENWSLWLDLRILASTLFRFENAG